MLIGRYGDAGIADGGRGDSGFSDCVMPERVWRATCLHKQSFMTGNIDGLSGHIAEVADLARCMVDSLKDTKKVVFDSFSNDLISQLNRSISDAESLLKPSENPNSELIAEISYGFGLLIGAAEAQIFSAYTQGVIKTKRSQGGKIGGQQGIYQKYETSLLRHFCRLHLKHYRNHKIALEAFIPKRSFQCLKALGQTCTPSSDEAKSFGKPQKPTSLPRKHLNS